MADAPAPQQRASRPPRVTTVEEVQRLSPALIRVVVGGEDLRDFAAGEFTDHYVKLQFAPRGASYSAPFTNEDIRARLPREEWPVTRTFTVRAWDPERLRLTIDFVDHGDEGVAGPWAANAKPGDLLQLVGPGGAYTPDPEADWHLLVGDTSVIPAIAASLERIPAGVPVHVLLEVADAAEEVDLTSPGDLRLTWLHRTGGPADEDLLVEAVRALDAPTGRVHAFVHGEASAVRAVRTHLIADRGIAKEDLSASGYWKRARTEDGWREDKAEWARLAEADIAAAS